MVRKIKKACDGTLEGFRTMFPKCEFKKTNQKNISRRYGKSWKVVCNHNITKRQCKICTPSIICPHQNKKNTCTKCNPNLTCKHMKTKEYCIICMPHVFCKHKFVARGCMKCNADKLTCEHGKKRNHCDICTPNRQCIHNKRKSHCVECSPQIICKHEVRKQNCLECTTWRQCKKCKKKHKSIDNYCTTCHPDFVQSIVGKSKVACKFIDKLEIELGVKIQHCHIDKPTKTWIGDEYRPDKWKKKAVDGFIPKNMLTYGDPTLEPDRDHNKDIIVEFLGDIFHGHPTTWDKITNHFGANLEGLFKDTEEKLAKLVSLGFVVFYVWEYDYAHFDSLEPVASICKRFIDKP